MINPDEDGKTHINIYSKGKTELGRLLTNFAHTPVDLGEDGKWQSLEAYWYWLLVKDLFGIEKHKAAVKRLRTLHGFQAKKYGKELLATLGLNYEKPFWWESFEFREKFTNAMREKIVQHVDIQEMLIESTLPFKHYYVYGDKVIEPKGLGWIIDYWNELREMPDYDGR